MNLIEEELSGDMNSSTINSLDTWKKVVIENGYE